jgi:ABC-type anion transport system duplicated permease subunit
MSSTGKVVCGIFAVVIFAAVCGSLHVPTFFIILIPVVAFYISIFIVAQRNRLISFYLACKKMEIHNIDTDLEKKKVLDIAKKFRLNKCTLENVNKYYEKGKSLCEKKNGVKTQSKNGKYIAIVVGIIIFIILVVTAGVASSSHKYDNVFNKNPNSWSNDEKEYVNGFFEWQDKQQSK